MNRAIADGSGSSPHTRGAQPPYPHEIEERRIIPAYAGSTRFWCRRRPRVRDHPRIRGEHPLVDGVRQPLPRIIPAYAGSTSRATLLRESSEDHPRIRGEHVHIEAPRCPQMGSSPHTRGARYLEVAVDPIQRIIPAYAGSTASAHLRGWLGRDHPRIRGEHLPRGRDAHLR